LNNSEKVLGLSIVLTALVWSPCSPALDPAWNDDTAGLVKRAHNQGPVKVTRPPSAFLQLATTISRGPAAERAAFARTAILTMADQYWQEIGKVRSQPHRDPAHRRKTSRWSAATLEYLDRLYDTADLIDEFTLVAILAGAGKSVNLFIDGAPVVLSGPRISDPDALGRQIVKEFCRLHACVLDTLVGHETKRSVRDRDVSDGSRSGWSFADGAGTTFVTDDGIHFMFTSLKDRERKQKAAMALMQDLRNIAAALMDASDQGYDIDWDRVRLSDSPVAGEHKLIVNRRGDYLRLRIPSLGRSAGFFRTSLSWVKARVEGRNLTLYVPGAEHVVAPLLEG